MRTYPIVITIVLIRMLMITGHTDAGVVLANNIPTGFQFTSFRGDVGFNDPPQFPNTADGQLFLAQASGKVESITSVIQDVQPGQSVPLDVGIYAANGTLPGSLLGNLVSIAPSALPSAPFTQVTLDMSSSGVNLVAGQSYFVLLTVTTPSTTSFQRYSEYWIDTGTIGFPEQPVFSPDGGTTWRLTGVPVADQIPLTISGEAAAVPEPASAVLLASGIGVVVFHLGLRRSAPLRRWFSV
jgi:hypothetical protein